MGTCPLIQPPPACVHQDQRLINRHGGFANNPCCSCITRGSHEAGSIRTTATTFAMQGFGLHHALNPDPYRGRFGDEGKAYAADVEDLILSATPGKVRSGLCLHCRHAASCSMSARQHPCTCIIQVLMAIGHSPCRHTMLPAPTP